MLKVARLHRLGEQVVPAILKQDLFLGRTLPVPDLRRRLLQRSEAGLVMVGD